MHVPGSGRPGPSYGKPQKEHAAFRQSMHVSITAPGVVHAVLLHSTRCVRQLMRAHDGAKQRGHARHVSGGDNRRRARERESKARCQQVQRDGGAGARDHDQPATPHAVDQEEADQHASGGACADVDDGLRDSVLRREARHANDLDGIVHQRALPGKVVHQEQPHPDAHLREHLSRPHVPRLRLPLRRLEPLGPVEHILQLLEIRLLRQATHERTTKTGAAWQGNAPCRRCRSPGSPSSPSPHPGGRSAQACRRARRVRGGDEEDGFGRERAHQRGDSGRWNMANSCSTAGMAATLSMRRHDSVVCVNPKSSTYANDCAPGVNASDRALRHRCGATRAHAPCRHRFRWRT